MTTSFTIVHILTTGSDERDDEIIEAAALRVRDGEVQAELVQLANPGCSVPLGVVHLTGIADEDVADEPSSEAVLEQLTDFIGDDPLVVFDGEILRRFLRSKSRGDLTPRLLDVRQLACVLLPTLANHDLDTLCVRFGLPCPEQRRAGQMAHHIAELWKALMAELEGLNLGIVSEMTRLLENVDHPLRELLEAAAKALAKGAFGEKRLRAEDFFHDYSHLIQRPTRPKRPDEPKPIDPGQIALIFDRGGLFAESLDGYEHRPQQIEMARSVCDSFNNARHLMVEAGTGTGKSLAYLVPAVYWAHHTGEQVIVSTNTKNLQDQLYFKDIPFLRDTLDVPFKAALIKGRSNYVCVRKLLHVIQDAEHELDEDERLGMLPVLTWIDQTSTGDLSENVGFFALSPPGLRGKLVTAVDECAGRACRRSMNCFVRKARALALSSNVVVANHAVVFAELGLENSTVLPEYRSIIFDEAHNIESVATEYLGVRVSSLTLYQVTNRLWRPRRDGAGSGLLASILFQVSRRARRADGELASDLKEKVLEAVDKIPQLVAAGGDFFDSLAPLVERRRGGEGKVAFKANGRRSRDWDTVFKKSSVLREEVGIYAALLDRIRILISDSDGAFEAEAEFVTELEGQAAKLRELDQGLEFVLAADDQNFVYWIEPVRRREVFYELCAAPLDITPLMNQFFFSPKDTVVMSSATLSVARRFDFMKQRLGASNLSDEQMGALDVGSPFDFDRQTLVCVPTFLPDPGDRDGTFETELAEMLMDLLGETQGRALVLFTSYAMLNHVHPAVKAAMESQGVLVLGQGIDGTRTSLLSTFQRDVHSVLLGTQSFWEGIDVVGESLSCLVLAKLPFAVFTEPIIRARCELLERQGINAFTSYSVPSAVIRLKQGFGRLIRTKTDRGVIVIADRRMVTRSYGQQFLRSLPGQCRVFRNKETLLRAVGSFLGPQAGADNDM